METITGLQRDRYGRPLVIPPDGGKPTPYTRCTTFVSALEDTYNLERWKMRQVAHGMGQSPNLVMAAAAAAGDKSTLDKVAQDAMTVAQSSAAADIGTALHKFTEDDDRGQLDLDRVPALYRADILAYRKVMQASKLTVRQIERFGVHDGMQIGGTWDREVTSGKRTFIADLKTGDEPLKYGSLKIAMQLAVYARCRAYDPATGARTDLDVDIERAIVIHLPAGKGKSFLHWVDIARGWEAVQVARQVREWRTARGLTEPFEYAKVEQQADLDPLMARIAAADDVAELRKIWSDNQSVWTEAHKAASKARRVQLTNEGN